MSHAEEQKNNRLALIFIHEKLKTIPDDVINKPVEFMNAIIHIIDSAKSTYQINSKYYKQLKSKEKILEFSAIASQST